MKKFLIFIILNLIVSSAFAGTNRSSVMKTRESGWTVAWGKHINHAEYAKLSLCMLDPTTVCINAYFTNLLNESATAIGKSIALQALKNSGKMFTHGNLQFQAGIATYNHWGGENPCSIWGGECWKRIPHPNTHQPYVRWRTQVSKGTPTSGYSLIINKQTGKALDAGIDVYMHPNPTKHNYWHLWRLQKVGNYFLIVNKKTGKALDAGGASGNDVYMHPNPNKNNNWQLWKLRKVGNYYLIINRHTGKALDAGADAGKGVYMHPHPTSNNNWQLWSIR